jgi:dTDP-4-dehydrorhamnose 3,5-epimerase-like enzyme
MTKDVYVKGCKLVELQKLGDDKRGYLSFLESNSQVDFEIKRMYYIYGVGDKNQVRGPHAHKKTKQLFICVNGSAVFHLDGGTTIQDILIDKPNVGILIENDVWHSMTNISKETVILVAASEKYDKDDYLMDHNKFIMYLNGGDKQ